MLEVFLCSLITILPDYLYRKYRQGKTWGKEITFFTMWYELRWGITVCAILAILLVTLIFYYHPSTNNAAPMFRTVSIMPEKSGRVKHVFVKNHQIVKVGTPLLSMFDESQIAAIENAEAQVQLVEAEFVTAYAQHAVTISVVERDNSAYLRSKHEYERKKKLATQAKGIISESELQKSADTLAIKKATLSASIANQASAKGVLDTILPAKRASAIKALEKEKVEKAKRTLYAHVEGELQQFALQPGDFINPMIRSAGIIVPTVGEASGKNFVQAGFNQLTANVIKVGTFAEITCMSKPFSIIPMKVASVQSVIATGQIRAVETLLDIQERARPGTLTVKLEPLYEGGLDGVIPGTKCIANVYSSHHELINSGTLSSTEVIYLHMVDAVGIVHAILLRMQALLLPVKSLVFSGH